MSKRIYWLKGYGLKIDLSLRLEAKFKKLLKESAKTAVKGKEPHYDIEFHVSYDKLTEDRRSLLWKGIEEWLGDNVGNCKVDRVTSSRLCGFRSCIGDENLAKLTAKRLHPLGVGEIKLKYHRRFWR